MSKKLVRGGKLEKKQTKQEESPMVVNKRTMQYDIENDILYIDANESEFIPKYLDYLLEANGIPKTAKRIFIRDENETNPNFN